MQIILKLSSPLQVLCFSEGGVIYIYNIFVPTHVVTLTQVGTIVYLGQTHLGTPFQVPAWVRKFSLGSTGDEIYSLIIIQGLFVQQKFEY